jgi:predicted alpha/beta hydrolase family esterase
VSETELIAINGTENENRIADVIFVHGLGGDALSTWHPQGIKEAENSWLTWLARDLEDIGIWSVNYEVEPFRWRGSTMPLADRATNVVDLLDIYEIGERPVIFITHSMGGLVVKQMLRHACDYGNPSWKKIVEQTKGIVFLSTPHSGSDIANWMKYIGGILGASVSVEELEANAPRLRELNTVYRNHAQLKEISIIVYCENEKTKGVMVVDQTSADPGIPGVTPIPLDENHISIAKPRSAKSQLYLRVKKFIKERLSNPQPLPPLHSRDRIAQPERIININQGNYNERIEGDYHQNSESKKKA